MKTALFAVISAFVTTVSALAHAADPGPSPEPEPAVSVPAAEAPRAPVPSATPRAALWEIGVGSKVGYLRSAGYDPYSKNDALAQLSFIAEAPVLHRGRFALAIGAGYAIGGAGDTIRGEKTSLTIHQLSVPIEGRYHFASWGFGFARVAPGATAALASLDEPSSGQTVRDTKWAFSTDLSAGAAILIGPRGPDYDDKRTIRFWALPEVGYSLATSAKLALHPDRDPSEALGTDDRTALRDLGLNAFFWRVSVATTF